MINFGNSSGPDIINFAPNGTYTTFASGLTDPQGLAFDSGGSLLVADQGSADVIRKYAPDGTQTIFASGVDSPTFLAFGPPAPTIESFSPTRGEAETAVTIAGNFFDGVTAVAFHGTAATFSVVSHTEVTATVPIGATTGPITVTTPSGTGNSSTNFTVVICIANPQTVAVAHNTATAVTLAGTSPDSLPLTFAIAANPTNGTLGTLDSATGAVTYTPNANFHGTDSFTFTVTDGISTSVPAKVTLKVAPGIPSAYPHTLSVILGTSTAITLTGGDPDVPTLPLTFAIATSPSNGRLSELNASTGAVTYTPNDGFRGTDSFTFTVSNGTNKSAPARVTLNVVAGTPTANPQNVSATHGTIKSITLTGTDPDSPALPLKFAIKTSPAHGSLGTMNTSTGAITYMPSTNFQGKDSFTFTVSNGTNTSAPATVTITVAPGAPTANPQTVSVAHNAAKKITLTGADPDSPALPLTFAIKTQPAHGTLSGVNSTTGVVTYTPGTNKSGLDSFTFTVNNGVNTSASATVTLSITPGVPTAKAETVSVAHNTAKAITLTGSDPDSPALPLTFAIVTSPGHGTLGALNKTTGAVTYTPNANFQGLDSFTFTVSNGTNTSSPATVTLKVVPGVPTANAQTVDVTENKAITITLTGTDPDSPALPLTFAIATGPTHGSLGNLDTTTGTITYTPDANYHGTDSFTFTVSNGTNKSAPAKVLLNIAGGG